MTRLVTLARERSAAIPHVHQRRFFEAAGVVATSAVHLALATRPELHILFVFAAIGGWGAYAHKRAREDDDVLRRWGFRTDNLPAAFIAPTLLALVAAGIMFPLGAMLGHTLHWTVLIPLAFYPLWGVVQQFLLQALVAGNLRDAGVHPGVVVAVTAVLFGLVHWPYPALMFATLLLGLAFTPMYLRWGNLWPLGLFHGWLGTLLYFLVLGRNPVLETFGLA